MRASTIAILLACGCSAAVDGAAPITGSDSAVDDGYEIVSESTPISLSCFARKTIGSTYWFEYHIDWEPGFGSVSCSLSSLVGREDETRDLNAITNRLALDMSCYVSGVQYRYEGAMRVVAYPKNESPVVLDCGPYAANSQNP